MRRSALPSRPDHYTTLSEAEELRAEADALRIEAAGLRAALEAIGDDAPAQEPEYQDWGGDTEAAEVWGGAQEHFRCAQIARRALGYRP